ncbi:MAG: DUF2264 domain-containing protein [Pseudochelatococcus sp.]|uniref:DUF2264 domain-containing protein n=1 Tax=Pseudochelatococcus sp. TaxID=2020869 RepID=UPI003D8F9D54
MTYDPASANPLAGNPFLSRDDVARAVHDLFAPLLPFFSEGGARVRLSATAAHFDRAAADLEGFARPLWGVASLAAGGGAFAHWDLYRRGLVNGVDPAHPEYWGDISDRDQRQVELAAIGFALLLAPGEVWEPLDAADREKLVAYLLKARDRDYVDNNWKFFRILVDLALVRCGMAFDRSKTEAYLDEIEGFVLDDGWYRDGPVRRADHYVPFAMHYYGLVYAVLSGDEERAARYRARARRFAADIRHWYGPDGAALPFGRSQTYRFAAAGFWGALAYAGEEALPWGEIKGYYLRHLRWWANRPIGDRDGVLSIGYGYPNLLMSESYNSAGSPYWAMKAFLPLALPADHPFWTAEEVAPPAFPDPVPLPQPGMVAMHTPGNVVVLSSGQQHGRMRGAAEKYAKFVYSTRYGFSVEADERNYDAAAFDGMIGFSDDGTHFRARETLEDARIAGDALWSRWRPFPDVEVETWLLPAAPWHLRIHRITTPRPLHATEGGFAIERADFNADRLVSAPGRAECHGRDDVSVIVDLSATRREGRAISLVVNSHLIWAKTILPQLRGVVPAGTTTLVTAAMALPGGAADVPLPEVPAPESLRQRLAAASVVPVFRLAGDGAGERRS